MTPLEMVWRSLAIRALKLLRESDAPREKVERLAEEIKLMDEGK